MSRITRNIWALRLLTILAVLVIHIISTTTLISSNTTFSVDDNKLESVTASVSTDAVKNASALAQEPRSKEATIARNEVVVIKTDEVELSKPTTSISKDDRPSCHDMDLDSLTKGEWDETFNIWKPDACQHIPFKPSDIQQCLAKKKITFYGDSLLRNIATELIAVTLGGHDKRTGKLENWAPSPYLLGGGSMEGGGGKIAMYWTPSAYFQKPSSVGSGSMEQDDVSIIGIGVWDMGTYFRGVNRWHDNMKALLTAAARKRNGKPMFVMHLHKLYSSKCKRVHNTDQGLRKYKICQASNGDDMVQKFRSALEHAVQCVKGSGFKNVYLLDTFGITNSTFAQKHSDDGVHYDKIVTQMELEVLMSGVCNGMRHHKDQLESLVCPKTPTFE